MPTVIICGTPGTGKSSLIEKIKPKLPDANYINLSRFAIENSCTSGYDEHLETHVVDDDKLIEKLEPLLANSELNIIESIHADHLDPERVDKVFVVRTDTTKLFDRLQARNYNQDKITNNVEAEIFQLIYDEAIEDFGADSVVELTNNDITDLDNNASLIHEKLCDMMKSDSS